jgi:lantibiotic modifying enzyme
MTGASKIAWLASAAGTLLLLAAMTPEARQPAGPRPHLAAAVETGRWLRSTAVKTEHGTIWPANPSAPDARTQPVNATLYSGTPGVVLFFLELHRATGSIDALRDARSGADHLLAILDSEKPQSGLYTGVAGVGFVLGEVYRATRDSKYLDGVRRSVEILQRTARQQGAGVEWTPVTDIISGSAGTGLYLLHAASELKMAGAKDLAVRAGKRLIELGQAEAGGTKWPMSPGMARLMPNFSHGTAGIAYFLARLYEETGDRIFLDSAIAGARYLQAVAKTDGDMCLIFHHEPEADGKDLYYLGYCHGPVGTARLWYQLSKVTRDKEWMEWVHKSARGVMKSGIPEQQTPGFWNNVGQCCGSAGVAEFFLNLHRLTGVREYLSFSERVTAQLQASATRDERGMFWVHAEHRVRPQETAAQTGWMQGAAGIGGWLLRLDASQQRREWPLRFPDSPFPQQP